MLRFIWTSISGSLLFAALASCNGGDMSGGGAKAVRSKKQGSPNGCNNDGTLSPDDGDRAYLTKPKFALMARDLRCGLCQGIGRRMLSLF